MVKTADSSDATVLHASIAALADCPLDSEELAALLLAQGLNLGPEPEERLLDLLDPDRFVELVDGRVVDVLSLAEGMILSHELTADEVASGRVALEPDLSVLEDLAMSGITLAAADGVLEHDHASDEAESCLVFGPPGWLGRDAATGALLTVEVVDGRTTVAVVPGPLPADPATVEALQSAYQEMNEGEDDPLPVDLFALWLEAAVADPDAFRRAQAPFGQLITGAGLTANGDRVAQDGFDWDEWEMLEAVDRIAERWHLDEMGEMAWVMLSTAYERSVAGVLDDMGPELAGEVGEPDIDTATVLARLSAMLSHENVARAFLGETLDGQPDLDGSLATFAQRLLGAAKGRTKAGPLWLLSICAERNGHTLDAEALLTKARLADDTVTVVLEDAAWYAADRGDTRRAASLLRAVDDPDESLLELYDRFARSPNAQVGRNDPCPCGSGRKYKHCHLGQAALPLAERSDLLYQKAISYISRGRHGRQIVEIAAALAGPDLDPGSLRVAITDPLTADLLLFTDGVWNDFVRDRGVLLPADELALAEQWQLAERSVHEVAAVEPGHTITVRDIRTGDAGHVAPGRFSVGELLCARVVPDGEGHQQFGVVEQVSRERLDELVALLDRGPSAVELAEWLAAARTQEV